MQGLVLGGLMQGVKVENQHFAGSVLDVVHPLPIISGLALPFGYAVLGGGWLKLKSNQSLQTFANRSIRVSAPFLAILFGVACIYAVKIQPSIHSKWATHGVSLACLVGLFAIVSCMLTTMTEKARPAVPFLLGQFLFVLGISSIALIAFPDIVPFSVTLWEAASSSTSQTLVLVGAAFVTPIVLTYSAFAYWIFRGKTPDQGWEA
jgi:cytochrome d ubiquinol oxidase subunit II